MNLNINTLTVAKEQNSLGKTAKFLSVGIERKRLTNGNTNFLNEEGSLMEFDNLAQVYRLLGLVVERNPEILPKAIFCDLNLIQSDASTRTTIAKMKMKKDKQVAAIPIIAINQGGTKVQLDDCLKLGIDDCYDLPLEELNVQHRINFLHNYKGALQKNGDVGTSIKYKMPIGKRMFDVAFAATLLFLLSPILLLIALLIKIESPGPIIYRSKRVGSGYQIFDFLKFRSMGVNADAQLKSLKHLNSYGEKDTNNTFFKLKNDPRVTRIGKFIRKTSIDELPQLWNVLMGNMSIIGNRPLPIYEATALTEDNLSKRFIAPAGITGLWQVNPKGKDNISTEERVGLDIAYADGFCFLMDVKILSRTLPAMIQKEA